MPKKKQPAKPTNRSNTVVNRLKPQQTAEAAAGEMMVEGLGTNAVTAAGYSKMLGELDLTECMAALIAQTRRVQGGNLADLEASLVAQAVTLNAMFTQLAYQTSRMTIVDQIDRFTRLALKAQGQCRATIETLAFMKNPPLFTRQANIAHGSQLVNNGSVVNGMESPARAEISAVAPNELLEAHVERVDGGAAGAAGARDPAVATMAEIDGATDTGRQSPRVAQRLPRR